MFTITIPSFPPGEEMTLDEYHEWLSENMEIEFDGDMLTGKVGGARPTENEGLFVNGLDLELWDSDTSEYRVVSSTPVGSLIMWASSSAVIPSHYLLCDGRTILRSEYPKLFTAIGTSFNEIGDDVSVFRLPDFRGRLPMGSGTGEFKSEVDITGSLPARSVGDYPGKTWPENTTPWIGSPTSGGLRFIMGATPVMKEATANKIADATQPSCVVQFLIRYE